MIKKATALGLVSLILSSGCSWHGKIQTIKVGDERQTYVHFSAHDENHCVDYIHKFGSRVYLCGYRH